MDKRKVREMKAIPFTLTLLLATGCATDSYKYKPTEQQAEEKRGAVYQIPAQGQQVAKMEQGQQQNRQQNQQQSQQQDAEFKGKGVVRVATFGVAEIKPKENAEEEKVLHVRMIIENDTKNETWKLSAPRQVLSLAGAGETQPAYVNTNKDEQDKRPNILIRPGRERVVDFYYPLPKKLDEAEELPRFTLSWQVQTGKQTFTESTPFDRVEITPDYATLYPYMGYGAYGSPYAAGLGYGYGYGMGWGGSWWGGPYGGFGVSPYV